MQYKFRSLIYIFLLEYLKLQYGDFLSIDIVMLIFPIKCFCVSAVSMVELAWQQPLQQKSIHKFLICTLFVVPRVRVGRKVTSLASHPSFFACRFSACTNGVSMEKKNVFISQAHTISACRFSACTNAISMYLKYSFLP